MDYLYPGDGEEWVEGGGLLLPGSPASQSAFWSVLGNQVCIAAFLEALILPDIPPEDFPNIICSCDGISALRRTALPPNWNKCSSKHIDLVSISLTLWESIPFCPVKQHVKGYQDVTNAPLPFLSPLTVVWMNLLNTY